MSDRLENFFNKATGKINLIKDVTDTVGSGPLGPQGKSFAITRARIANLPIEIGGRLEASTRIHGVGQAVTIFEFENPDAAPSSPPIISLPALPGSESRPEEAEPPDGTAFSELVIFIGASASATFKPPATQALSISAGASASGSMRYRLMLPAGKDTQRVAAIGKLLESARPPQLLDLPDLVPGELHTFDARFQLGFDLKAEMGKSFDFSTEIDLFDDVSPTLSAHADATLSASLGWSVYDRLQMSVGKVNVGADDPHWVRIRLQRLNRRELTLGAKLAVQVEYDLGQETFAALLERILEIEPLERLFDQLQEVEDLGLHKINTAEEWEAVRNKLSARLGDIVLEYVDVPSVVAKLPFEKVEPFIDDIKQLVVGYRGLDQKIQSLVRSILGRVDLAPGSKLRNALDEIAALDPKNLDEVLDRVVSPGFQEAIDLLELLSGSSIDELLVGTRAAKAVEEAAALATQTVKFLDGLDASAIKRLHAFTENTGIDNVIDWLETNATSLEDLQEALEDRASSKIRELVGRLINKAWDALDADDFKRIKSLAASLSELNVRRKEIEEKLNKAVEALKGEAGFSVGIEISRLTERAAIIDLEVDSKNKKVRKATEEALAGFEARELLDKIAKADDGDGDDPGFRLRDSIFSYRRVRSSSLASFFSFLGIKRARQTVRVDEEVVRVFGIEDKNILEREATYSTGTVRRITDGSKDALAGSHELGVWHTWRVAGRGAKLDDSYDREVERGLRIVYSRADNKTLPGEIGALGQLMADLGFVEIGGAPVGGEIAPPEEASQTEFSFSLELGPAAASALFKNKIREHWWTDFRNAAHRWLDEELVPTLDKAASGSPRARKGRLLARVIESRKFDPALKAGLGFYGHIPNEPWNVEIGDHAYRVPIRTKEGMGRYRVMNQILFKVNGATKKLGQTVDAFKQAKKDLKPADLRLFDRRFSTLLKRTPFANWPSPMFNLWLVFARIGRSKADALDEARGIATLRFRPDADDPWQERRWQLKGAHRGTGIFPF